MVAKRWRQPELLPPLSTASRTRRIPPLKLEAKLTVPNGASVLIVFGHGRGSGHVSPRNRSLACALNAHGMATLLFDLLTPVEGESLEAVFDIALLRDRLATVLQWLKGEDELVGLPVGLFGAGPEAAAAMMIAARPDAGIFAIVSRGGRPDLAGESLERLAVPVLLLVGARDPAALKLNEEALACLRGPKQLKVIPGAGQCFEEPESLEEEAACTVGWFEDYSPVRTRGRL